MKVMLVEFLLLLLLLFLLLLLLFLLFLATENFLFVLLTGVELSPVSNLVFISVSGSWHHFLSQIDKWLSEGTNENKFISGIIF